MVRASLLLVLEPVRAVGVGGLELVGGILLDDSVLLSLDRSLNVRCHSASRLGSGAISADAAIVARIADLIDNGSFAGGRVAVELPAAVGEAGDVVDDSARVWAHASGEDDEAEEKGTCDGPYYDAPVEAVAEQRADGEAWRGLDRKWKHDFILEGGWRRGSG